MSDEQPTSAERPDLVLPSSSPASSSSSTGGPEPPLVLIADDEEPIAEALSWIVEDLGYATVTASNGREALELARSRRPALLITDWMMPFLDGPGLIRALRQQAAQDGQTPIPMILLSAASKRKPAGTEADAFLTKPFNLEDLEALLHRFLPPMPLLPDRHHPPDQGG